MAAAEARKGAGVLHAGPRRDDVLSLADNLVGAGQRRARRRNTAQSMSEMATSALPAWAGALHACVPGWHASAPTDRETSMNFDFSDDLKQLRDQARRFLRSDARPAVTRRSLDEQEPFDGAALEGAWPRWAGSARRSRRSYGGAGLGHEASACWRRNSAGVVAPIPFASTAYLAAEAILLAGSEAQKATGCRSSRPAR